VVAPVQAVGEDLLLSLRVQPKAARDELLWQGDGLKLRITAPPVDGKANAHLIAYLAKLFRVAKGSVEIVSGEGSREKRIRIRRPQQLPPLLAQTLVPSPVAARQGGK
jgi:uncharacterized protein (TIGR00251 family)